MTAWLADPVAVAVRIALVMLLCGIVLGLVRLLRGPTLADRAVALDLITVHAVGITGAYALMTRREELLDVAIVLALVGFLAIVSFARLVQHGDES